MEWYYMDGGQQVGPVSDDEFQNLLINGTIQPETPVWNTTMTDWTKYGKLSGSKSGGIMGTTQVAGSSERTCWECGGTFSEEEMIPYENAWVCAACKPVFVQKLKEGVGLAGVMAYAGFWRRFGALVIDFILLWGVQMIISIPPVSYRLL